MSKGFIKLHRKILTHWINQDPIYLWRWMQILLNVNWQSKECLIYKQVFTCEPGQSFYSLRSWAMILKCTPNTVLRFFRALHENGLITHEIIQRAQHPATVITVINWSHYQDRPAQGSTHGSIREPIREPIHTKEGLRSFKKRGENKFQNNSLRESRYLEEKENSGAQRKRNLSYSLDEVKSICSRIGDFSHSYIYGFHFFNEGLFENEGDLVFKFNARLKQSPPNPADEVFTRKGGGEKLGEKLAQAFSTNGN